MASTETEKLKTKAKASLTLLLVAVISITTATYAWFTMSNSTTVQNMVVQVGTGAKLEVSTYNGGYDAVLTNDEINTAMKTTAATTDWDFDYINGINDIRLWPLSSGDGINLYTKTNNDNVGAPTDAKKGYYLELPLWFKASTNMNVYLNANDFIADDKTGTSVTAAVGTGGGATAASHRAVRISFTPADRNNIDAAPTLLPAIYEPEKQGTTGVTISGQAQETNPTGPKSSIQTTFKDLGTNAGLKNGVNTTPVLFGLVKDVPKQVTIRIWIEGADPECVNLNGSGQINIEKELLTVRLRLCGADKDGNYIEAAQE